MNISAISTGTATEGKGKGSGAIYAGSLMMNRGVGLKSTQQKQERQQKMQSEVDFWEKQKESLKGMECATVEEIAEKLEKLHDYEDNITAAKAAYNNEQMMHVMDEAKEIGEKIAKAAEKMAPKTEEERKKEAAEEAAEAAGTEESDGLLEELLEEAGELEELVEEQERELEELSEEQQEKLEEFTEELDEKESKEALAGSEDRETSERIAQYDTYHSMWAKEWYTAHRGMDYRL